MWKTIVAGALCLGLSTCGILYAQQNVVANQLALVQQGRDFCERLAAQAVVELENKLAMAQEELKQYKEKHPEVKVEAQEESK